MQPGSLPSNIKAGEQTLKAKQLLSSQNSVFLFVEPPCTQKPHLLPQSAAHGAAAACSPCTSQHHTHALLTICAVFTASLTISRSNIHHCQPRKRCWLQLSCPSGEELQRPCNPGSHGFPWETQGMRCASDSSPCLTS